MGRDWDQSHGDVNGKRERCIRLERISTGAGFAITVTEIEVDDFSERKRGYDGGW